MSNNQTTVIATTLRTRRIESNQQIAALAMARRIESNQQIAALAMAVAYLQVSRENAKAL
jgi:hypothetical protein